MIMWQDILAILVVAVACVYVVRYVTRSLRRGGGCGCGKGDGCPSSAPERRPDATVARRIPLVTVNPPSAEADGTHSTS